MRGVAIIEAMVIDMNEAQVRTLEQVRQVVAIISHTEQQLRMLLAQTEGRLVRAPLRAQLAGPQVPDKAVAQADVDDLLAAMGY